MYGLNMFQSLCLFLGYSILGICIFCGIVGIVHQAIVGFAVCINKFRKFIK